MRAPLIWREARVAYHCPEIRKSVIGSMFLRPIYRLVVLAQIIVGAPFALLLYTGILLTFSADKILEWLSTPSHRLRNLIGDRIEADREVLPLKEIQRRLYGDGPIGGFFNASKKNKSAMTQSSL